MKEWCCHIDEPVKLRVDDSWKFCPICGTPRPEEPKKLWENIRLFFEEKSVFTDSGKELDTKDPVCNARCRHLSDVAKSHIIEVIKYHFSSIKIFYPDNLIKAIEEC